MRSLERRLSKLEARRSLSFPQRIVVRYPGDEPYRPEPEIDGNTLLVIVEYVEAPLPAA